MTGSEGGRRGLTIAGETSGDNPGARVVTEMAARDPDLEFFGIGSEKMKRAGVEVITDSSTLSVVGITEVFSRLPAVIREASRIKKELLARRPDLLILIDFPDFNLHMARFAKKHDIAVLYYISPQVWAWRRGRVRKIRKYVDRMAVILPFESDFYLCRGVKADFVGHPLLDHYSHQFREADQGPEQDGSPVVALLPGSRGSEIARTLPVMLAAARRLEETVRGVSFLVSAAPGIDRQWINGFIQPYRKVINVEVTSEPVWQLFGRSSLAVAASGTVTLEAAIFGMPMVVIYRVSALSYLLGKMLVSVDHIGLANIIAGQRVVPELIQNRAGPGEIARTAAGLLTDPAELARLRVRLRSVRKMLGTAGASARTAEIALSMIREKHINTGQDIKNPAC